MPQGRKVTPGWTPIETAYTPQWEAGRGGGEGYADREMDRMTADRGKTGLKGRDCSVNVEGESGFVG